MPVYTTPSPLNDSSVVLLVEDDGLVEFLPPILDETVLSVQSINIMAGGGWTGVYKKYDELIASGIDADRIIPVLDADVLGAKTPTSSLHSNQRILRFQFDFEFEFATWDCMLLDHALLLLVPTVFGAYGSVEALFTWTEIVNSARIETTKNRKPTLSNVEILAKQKMSACGAAPEGLVMPSKVTLANALAKFCIATGALPPDVAKLLRVIHKCSTGQTSEGLSPGVLGPRPLWNGRISHSLPHREGPLTGDVLFSPSGVGLSSINLPTGNVTPIPGSNDLGWGSWLPDGRIAATVVDADGVVLTDADDATQRTLLRQGVRESFLCWDKQQNRALLRDANEQVFSVSQDSKSWLRLNAPGYGHCVNRRGILAWTPHDYRDIYVCRISELGQSKFLQLPDVVDARHSIAWSHKGDELAFVNADVNDSRRTICIWNKSSNETQFVLPWIGKPDFIAWSPDDRFILARLQEHQGLFVVDVRSSYDVKPLLQAASNGGVFKCGAWRN